MLRKAAATFFALALALTGCKTPPLKQPYVSRPSPGSSTKPSTPLPPWSKKDIAFLRALGQRRAQGQLSFPIPSNYYETFTVQSAEGWALSSLGGNMGNETRYRLPVT